MCKSSFFFKKPLRVGKNGANPVSLLAAYSDKRHDELVSLLPGIENNTAFESTIANLEQQRERQYKYYRHKLLKFE